eukprot:7104132-Alexandrium_andersonii.AAC.1
MSASLVGSEMCIRDSSALRSRRGSAAIRLNRHNTINSNANHKSSEGGSTCLLYTSDAADDM